MLVVVFLCVFVLLIYTVWLITILKGWLKLKEKDFTNDDIEIPISVVIPFRNESRKIDFLLNSLLKEIDDNSNTEVIYIDDHSIDDSSEIVKLKIAGRKNFYLIKAQNEGKKNALRTGIQIAKHEWIVSLDADVQIPSGWHSRIKKHCAASKSSLMILPLFIDDEGTFFGASQSLEFMSITGITAGSAANNNALLCNGAHLAFRKESYQQSIARRKDSAISSGDDMFLLSDLKKNGFVTWIHDPKIVAVIKGEKDLKSFINQRVRWASKTGSLPDSQVKLAGLIVTLANLALIVLWTLMLLEPRFFIYGFTFTFIKISNDYHLTKKVATWMCKTRLMRFFIPVSLIYPFYAILIPLIGLFYKPKWKGRKVIN